MTCKHTNYHEWNQCPQPHEMAEQNKGMNMSFTDEDLKRWKYKFCSGHPSERDEEVEALLARLEAAEAICFSWERMTKAINMTSTLLEAWQKTSGK